ncbi:alpha/beta hydrolase [Aquiflexum gelatinilyticum]|uniref:alpha/beta hydrolase n=1 Tax=Aquiflexum gelatinilyticum TaxID=2961943 RepID=UPI002168C84C|nr:alpha/beta hydrolase-fold protein [Aquiflexum gelatinilyticum]MCS4435890.1 alpha/beta hydrolase-fold protein [Aquiflexum gelatinilyticum]
MYKKLLFLSMALIMIVSQSKSQSISPENSPPQTIIKQLKNDKGAPYELAITLPSAYQPEKEYKILYYLDAYWLQDMVRGCYRLKAMSSEMEEVILVGILSVGNEKDWHKQRNMDYTPTVYDLSWLKLKIEFGGMFLDETNTGGAEHFMHFLKNQIIPTIEKEYKVNAKTRGILGHSFGGLLAFYSFVNYNDLFANYILLAPAIWWNDSEIFQDKASLLSQKEAKMFIAMGTGEINMLKIPLGKLTEELKSKDNEKLVMTYKQYENATHNSVLPQGIYDGIELLYTKSK